MLFMEMRLGKTRVAVAALRARVPEGENILIVAPYSALASWALELDTIGASYSLWTKDSKYSMARWILINKDAPRRARAIVHLSQVVFYAVVLDESPFIKNPQSDMFAFWSRGMLDKKPVLSQSYSRAPLRMILSGMPAPESPLEYYTQLAFCGEDFGCSSYWEWRQRYCVQPPLCPEWFLTRRGEQKLKHILERRAFILRRKDSGIVETEKQYITRTVVFSPEMRKIYTKAEEDFVLELPPEKSPVRTSYALTRAMWLHRLAGGFYEGKLWAGKLNAMVDLVAGELKESQIIIWAAFTEELAAISKATGFPIVSGEVPPKKRAQISADLFSGKIRGIAAQPACARYGVNWSAADVAIYYSSPYGLDIRTQSEDRIVQVGASGIKLIIDFITEGTVDADIKKSIARKERKEQSIRGIVASIQSRTAMAKHRPRNPYGMGGVECDRAIARFRRVLRGA